MRILFQSNHCPRFLGSGSHPSSLNPRFAAPPQSSFNHQLVKSSITGLPNNNSFRTSHHVTTIQLSYPPRSLVILFSWPTEIIFPSCNAFPQPITPLPNRAIDLATTRFTKRPDIKTKSHLMLVAWFKFGTCSR